MDQLLTKPIKLSNVFISLTLLFLGFLNLSFGWVSQLSPYSLAITGIAAFLLTFGTEAWSIVNRPIQPIKNFLIYFPISVITSLGTSLFLLVILNLKLTANPISNHVPWLQLPVMLLGEELISFFIFIVTAILLSKYSHHVLMANLISAVVFAFLHISTYWNGNLLMTVFHVLALQGIARLIFNTAGIKSNTILVPLVIHILFDVFALLA